MTETQAAELLAKLDELHALGEQLRFVDMAILCGVGFLWAVQFTWICLMAVRAKSWWG